MTQFDRENDDSTLSDQAVNWLVRLDAHDMTAEERRAFEAWRRQSPAHRHAFAEIENLWQDFDRLAEGEGSKQKAAGRNRQRWVPAVAMAAVVCLMVWTTDVLTIISADYHTGIGEHRIISLEDGSTVHLNTDSALTVDMSSESRRMTLLKGEALFVVAPDADRPFQAIADEGISTALGTEFMVRHRTDKVSVTVLESRVAVTHSQADSAAVTLSPGQKVVYSTTAALGKVETADLRAATAWRRGKIIFEDLPLGEVIAELNRYHSGHILIIDPRIRSLHVNGVFDVADTAWVVEALESSLPLRSTWLTDYLILLHR